MTEEDGMCKRGCSKGRKASFWLLLHINPKRKQSSHLPNSKILLLLVFSPCHLCVHSLLQDICMYTLYCKTSVCTFSIARHLHVHSLLQDICVYTLYCKTSVCTLSIARHLCVHSLLQDMSCLQVCGSVS